jgi:putative endonuclease
MNSSWFVYVLRTSAGHLYTGITTDVDRRLAEHSGGARGARSLRGKGPLTLVFQHPAANRSEASRLEARIKKLGRADKERLVAGDQNLLQRVTS